VEKQFKCKTFKYQMNIRIDIREHDLINLCKTDKEGIEVTTETLPIGDIILTHKGVDKVIIERKSISDLLASIKDGRYEEQSYRLSGSEYPNHNIIYLIEGDIKRYTAEKQMIYSALFSLNYYKGFSVVRTLSLQETADYILSIAVKLVKSEDRTPYYSTSDKENINDKDYVNVVKKVKKDNITPNNINEIMLSQIPGISSTAAIAIMEQFKTIPNLITSIQNDPKCLSNVCFTNTKGQSRKINKTCSTNIATYLLNTEAKI
jgi:ERCC4-type nuclease